MIKNRKLCLGRRSRSTVVVVLWLVALATLVAVYELGYVRGEIAAMESEETR